MSEDEEERKIKLGPVELGIGGSEGEEEGEPDLIKKKSQLDYAMNRFEKKAKEAEKKYEKKRAGAKEALREGYENRARARLNQAKRKQKIANKARKNALSIETLRDQIDDMKDARELQNVTKDLAESIGDFLPEDVMEDVQESTKLLGEMSTRIDTISEEMTRGLVTATSENLQDEEIEEEMEKLTEEVQAETAEELEPAEIEEKAEATKLEKELESGE